MPGKHRWMALATLCALLHAANIPVYAESSARGTSSETDPHEYAAAKEKSVYFTIRWGQGGFTDYRSPIDKLGGGQLTLDVKPRSLPLAISISTEYYTNCPDPTYSYEIASLYALNLLYMAKPFHSDRITVFAGGGAGSMLVPLGEDRPEEYESGMLVNFEAGVNVRVYRKMGIYGIGKYLYSQKERDGVKLIDFSEFIVLLGLTVNFGF